jgi:hypothetical protein
LAAGAEMDCHAVRFEVRLKNSRKRFNHAKKSNHAKKHSRQEYDAITGIPVAPQNLVIESFGPAQHCASYRRVLIMAA